MVHTLPDYTSKWKNKTIFSIVDNGELAVRLGGINTYDRRGNVIWLDDFEDGINKWNTGGNGLGNAVTNSVTASMTKGASAKLTTGSTGAFNSQMYMYRALPVLGKLGHEFSFTFDNDMAEIIVYFYVRSGLDLYLAGLKLDNTNDRIQYYDNLGAWQDLLTAVSWQYATYNFATIKLVADFANNTYERLIFRDTETDMTAYPLRNALAANEQRWEWFISCTGTNGNNAVCYVDNVIITQNEV